MTEPLRESAARWLIDAWSLSRRLAERRFVAEAIVRRSGGAIPGQLALYDDRLEFVPALTILRPGLLLLGGLAVAVESPLEATDAVLEGLAWSVPLEAISGARVAGWWLRRHLLVSAGARVYLLWLDEPHDWRRALQRAAELVPDGGLSRADESTPPPDGASLSAASPDS